MFHSTKVEITRALCFILSSTTPTTHMLYEGRYYKGYVYLVFFRLSKNLTDWLILISRLILDNGNSFVYFYWHVPQGPGEH